MRRFEQLKEIVPQTETIDYGNASYQLREIINSIKQGEEVNWQRYSQVSEETKDFLKRAPYAKGETEFLISRLLVTPSPKEQTRTIQSVESLFLPENQERIEKEKKELLQKLLFYKTLEMAESEGQWNALLNFYQNPENQKIKPELLNNALDGAESEGQWNDLLNFCQNPKNQKIKPELLNKALEMIEGKGRWYALLIFYQNPENQGKLELLESLPNKILSSVNRIADENLRGVVLGRIKESLLKDKTPLSLISLESADELPILATSSLLAIDPLIIKSWKLDERERETLLPLFSTLSENHPDLFQNLNLPFQPREEIKKVKDFKGRITDWLYFLNFLSQLKDIGGEGLLRTHLKNLKELQKEYEVKKLSLEFPFSFLKKTLKETEKIKKEVLDKFLEIISLEQREISFEEFQEFCQSWNFEISQILTLAAHYRNINYQEGLKLLADIVESIIKGNYFEKRYDLKDSLTKEQLSPITELTKEGLNIWRKPLPFLEMKTTTKVETKTEEINLKELTRNLEERWIKERHLQSLFSLKEFEDLIKFQKITKEQKEDLLSSLSCYLEKPKEKFNIGEFKKKFTNVLEEKKLNIFIGLIQFSKDLSLGIKETKEIKSALDRLLKGIEKDWPELYNLEFINLDLKEYLLRELEPKIEEKEELDKVFLNFFSDHPKTLLEIGKYPDSSSCENYESKGEFNKALLGYVFDSQIKAVIVSELESKGLSKEELEGTQFLAIDEGKRQAVLSLKDGRKIELSFSRPLARKIVMLGRKKQAPVLVVEKLYRCSQMDEKLSEELISSEIKRLKEEFFQQGIKLKSSSEIGHQGIEIAGSHNPKGHYNDLAHKIKGIDGESYQLSKYV